MDNVFDYIELDDDYAIYEIPPLKEWIGKSIRQADIARNYQVTVLGVRDASGEKRIMPSADYVVDASEHLMVLSERGNMAKLLKRIKK